MDPERRVRSKHPERSCPRLPPFVGSAAKRGEWLLKSAEMKHAHAGSGKKFKKCCGVAGVVELPAETRRALSLHQRDQQLVEEILRFARKRFGAGWLAEVAATYFDDFAEGDHEVQLLVPWAVYQFEKDGRTAAQLFLYERGRHLSDETRGWLEAQGRAWLSVWEVFEVEAGIGVSVRDLLTREQRFIYEVKGSKLLKLRDCVLARVIDHGGVSTFCGMHPRSLLRVRPSLLFKRADVYAGCERGQRIQQNFAAWIHNSTSSTPGTPASRRWIARSPFRS